jgi:signal transduction histidine kinase
MATAGGGVLRREDAGWETIPASLRLATVDFVGLRRSPSGGIWVVTSNVTRRVDDRPDLAEGWKVLEEITGWHGVPEVGREDVLELEDGTLWITTGFGPARLPAGARQPLGVPSRVELAEMIVDGSHIAPEGLLRLPYHRNRLELHFSALSYRDPGLLRYRIRTGRDEGWSEPVRSPFIRFADLAPGAYRVEVAASLDSVRWSEAPAVLDLVVGRPWYRQGWFVALAALCLAAGIYAIHRARVESLLRLERQRERIARDLHDEMGSALGSVGILAELASGDRLDESRRRAVSGQIAETVSELGATLDDIVWSLAHGARKVDSLAAELASRGRRLIPDGTSAFRTRFPRTWPEASLSPAVFRNVLRIAVEALHNAARHSGARSVSLALEPIGRRWRLRVEDDGNGLPADPAEAGTGLGLAGMRRRAEEIGAEITWESPPGGGTAVTLEFDPDAEGRRFLG